MSAAEAVGEVFQDLGVTGLEGYSITPARYGALLIRLFMIVPNASCEK